MSTDKSAGAQRLSHDDVAHLVGDLEDATIAAILATGASYADVEQAIEWLEAGSEGPRPNSHGLTPQGEIVYDILLTSGAFDLNGDRNDARSQA